MASLWCKFLCKCSIYNLQGDQWIIVWWAKFESECLLLIFIYFHSKFSATCKNGYFECQYIRTCSEENCLKFPTSHLPFWLFLIKILQLNCYPEYFGVYFFWWTIRRPSKWFILPQESTKSRVRQSQVCYLHTTHSPVFEANLLIECMLDYNRCQVNWFTLCLLRTTDQNAYSTKPMASFLKRCMSQSESKLFVTCTLSAN